MRSYKCDMRKVVTNLKIKVEQTISQMGMYKQVSLDKYINLQMECMKILKIYDEVQPRSVELNL